MCTNPKAMRPMSHADSTIVGEGEHHLSMSITELSAFVEANAWTYAKTMPQCPHEYVVRKNIQKDEDFCRFVMTIRRNGYDERYYSKTHRYLEHGSFKYWTMGDWLATTIIINRTQIDAPARPIAPNPTPFVARVNRTVPPYVSKPQNMSQALTTTVIPSSNAAVAPAPDPLKAALRITTWNCARKRRADILPAVAALRSDFALLQEIARPDVTTPQELWIGTNPRQGVSVLSCTGFALRLAKDYDENLQFGLPVEVIGPHPFQLLSIWAMKGDVHYVPNLVSILEHYRSFIERAPTVVAGDFNANPGFDAVHPEFLFRTITAKLDEYGLVSAYHTITGESHGHETRPTLYHTYNEKKAFHIDYLCCPKAWMPSLGKVEVGGYADYAKLSDHRPMTVTIKNGALATE